MKIKELLEQRAKLIADARALHTKSEKEKRSLSAEEIEQFDKHMTEAGSLKERADRLQTLEDEERSLAAAQPRQSDPDSGQPTPPTDDEQRSAFYGFMRTGQAPRETRAGAPWTTTDAEGGYMAPTAVAKEIIDRVQDLVYMLAGSRVYPLMDAKAIQIPKFSTAISAAAWRTEAAAAVVDSASIFGAETLTPQPLSLEGYVSNNLLHATGNLAEQAIIDHIAKNMAEGLESAFVAGTGSGQPTGVFNETSSLTAREVFTSSQTAFTWDDLAEAVGNQRATYRRGASWLVHREFVTRTMKLKDSEGRPIYLPSVAADKPDTIMGYPVWESEFASNTFTADKRIAVFGNFQRGYGIALTRTLRFIRLMEKYASYDATGYVAHAYADGKVIDDTALTALHTAV